MAKKEKTDILSPDEIAHPDSVHNRLLLHWKAPEYILHKKSTRWFMVAGVIILMLIAYAIYTDSATMAIVFILLAGVYYLTHNQHPKVIDIKITDLGVFVGNTFYHYHMINSFWLVYHPPYINTLNLRLAGKTMSKVVIQLDRQNPVEVRQVLSKEIPEVEGEEEGLSDTLIRLLRL